MALPPYDRRGLRRTDDELLDRTSIQETDYEALDKANAASMGSFRRGRMQHDIQRDANRQYSEAAEARREGKADWEEKRAKGNEYARQAAAYAGPETDLRNVKGLGDLGAFSAFHLGSESDNLLTGLAGGALMGAGKKTKIKALTRAGQGLVGYQAADDYVQGVDSIQGEQLNDPDMLKADPNDALTAARIGGGAEIATGLVPVASGMKVAGRVLRGGKPGSRLADGLAGTGTAFVAEGTTEVGADLVSHAANVALANKQKSLDPWDLANSFAAGGVVGGGTHAGADYVGDILQGGVAAVRGAKNALDAKRAAPSTPGAEPGAESPKGKTGWERIRPDFMSGDRAPVDLNDDEGLVARTKAATTNAYSAAKDAAAGVFKDTPHSVSGAFAQAKEYAGKVREQGREAFAEYVEPKWNEFIETREARRAEVEAATAPLYESADNVEFESVWAAARDTVSNVVDEASVMINDALVAMDSMKRDVKDPQFEQVDGAVKSVKAELDDIKSELASIAEEESANLSASSIDVGVSPAQRKKMREKQAAKAGELTERKKTVAQRAKQATEYLGRMAEEGILDATAVVARTRKAASKYTPSWDFRFNGEDYGLGGEFFDAKLKAMSSVVDDVKLGGGRAIDALSNIFGSGRDVADAQSLLSGMDEAAILGADPAETAANMARSAAKNVELATKFRNSLLKENKLSEGSLTKLMQLNPADPADQKGIAQMYLDQSKVQEMEQTLRDVESQMGEDGEAKMSLIGMDQVDPEFVSALSKLLGPSNASKAPVMALRIIRAATFLGDPTQFRAGFANELKSKISVASMVSDPESFFNRTIDASGVTVGKGDRYEMAQAVDAAARKHYDKSLDISDESMATLETMYKVLEADSSEDRHGPIRGLLAYYAAVHATGEQRDITKGNMNVAVLALSDALTTRFQYSVEEMDPSGRLSELVEQYLPAEKAPNVDKTKLDGQSFTYRTAVSDVGRAREESFLWGLMAGNLGTDAEGFETMTMNVASFVDTNAVNFAQMDEFRQSQVLKTLITAVGDEESARSVLTYYGVAARMMIEQQQARDKEMGITALEDGAEVDSLITQMAERSDTTTEAMYKEAWDVAGPEYDEEAQKGVVEADEADPNSGFQTFDADSTENSDVMYNQDSKSKRPFLKGREKDDAALAELLEELGPEARVRNYGEVFAAERRASTFDGGGKNSVDVQTAAMSELTRMVEAVKAVRDEHYKKDRGIQEGMLAEMEARAAKEPLTVENHRKMVALRKKVAGDNLEDRSAMIAVNDAEIKAIEDGMIKAREAANEKRKTDPTAEADYVSLLDMYQVVTTPNDGQGATNEDLRAYRADSNGANTPVIKFKFKPAGGKEYTRNLSPVAMVKHKDATGYTTHERLASVMAKVMNRSDYVGFEDPGVGYMLGLKEHGHAFRWGDFISAQSQVDLDAMTEASIAKFMEPLESDAVKSARIDARKEAGPKPEPEKTLAERLVDRAFGVEEAAARKEKDTQFGRSQGAIQADEAKEGVLNMLNAITIETGFKPSEELASEYSKAMAVGLEKANAEVAKLEAEVNAVNNQESPAYRRAMKRYQEAKVKRNKLANRLNDASIEDGVLRDWKDYGKERTELARSRMQALLKGGTAVNGKLSQLQAAHDALSNKQTKEAKALMRQIYELRAKNKELARAARSYAEALNPWDSEAYQEQRDIQEALDDERGSYANLYPKVAMAEAEIDALRAQIESLRLGLKTGDVNDTSKFRNKGKVRKVAEGAGEVWDFAAKPIQERLKKAETELDILMRSIPREERDRMRIVDDVATGPTKEDIGLAGVSLDTAVEMTGATYLANSFFGLNKKDDEAGGVTPENLNEVAGILPALHAALSAKGVASLPPAERKLYDKIDALLTEVAKREGSNPADLTKLIRSGKNFGQNLGSGRTNEGKEKRQELWRGAMRAIRKGMSDDQISAISGIKADRVVDLGYVDAILFSRGGMTPEQVLKASAMIPRVVEALGEQDPNILSEQDLDILNAARAYSRGRGSNVKAGALFDAVESQEGLTGPEKRQLWLMANAASLGQDAPTPKGDDLSAYASLMRKMSGKREPGVRETAEDKDLRTSREALRTYGFTGPNVDSLTDILNGKEPVDSVEDAASPGYAAKAQKRQDSRIREVLTAITLLDSVTKVREGIRPTAKQKELIDKLEAVRKAPAKFVKSVVSGGTPASRKQRVNALLEEFDAVKSAGGKYKWGTIAPEAAARPMAKKRKSSSPVNTREGFQKYGSPEEPSAFIRDKWKGDKMSLSSTPLSQHTDAAAAANTSLKAQYDSARAELDALEAEWGNAEISDIPDSVLDRADELDEIINQSGGSPRFFEIPGTEKAREAKYHALRGMVKDAPKLKTADPDLMDKYRELAVADDYISSAVAGEMDSIARNPSPEAVARMTEKVHNYLELWSRVENVKEASTYVNHAKREKIKAQQSKDTSFLRRSYSAASSPEISRVNSEIKAKADGATKKQLEGMINSAQKRLAKADGGLREIISSEVLYMNNLLQTKFGPPAAGLLDEGKMSLASTPLSQRTDAELADIKERAIRGILQSRGDGVTVTFGSLASIGGAGKYKHDVETRYREIQIALDVADPLGAARHEVLHDFLRSFGASDANRALKKQLLRALSTRKNRTLLEAMMRQEGINEEAIAQLKDPEEAAAYFFQYYGYNTSFREDFLADPANAPAATVFQKLADWVDSVVNAVYKALGAKTNDQKALAMLDMLINGEAITNEDFEHRAIDRKLETNWNKFIRTTGPIIPGSRKVQFPATHFLRSLNSDAANKIADMFAPEPGSAHTGFMKDKQQTMSTYLNRFEDVIDGLNKEQLHALGVEASSMKPATSEKGAELQKLLNDLYDYQTKAGVATLNTENNEWIPLRRVENYGVRKWNPTAVSANKAGFIELMSQYMNAERAENLYSAIIAGDGAIEMAQTENDLGYTPFHSSALSRQLTFITPENVQTFMPFIETDIREVMASYISQAVHRAEYTRAFGNGGALIARLMSQAQAEGVSSKDLGSMNAAVKSMQGTLDHPWASPTYKKSVGYAITVQNFALLPLITFSSMFTDPMGVAVRTGSYKKAGKTMLSGLNQVVRDVRGLEKTKRERLARRLGIVAEDNLLDAMGQSAHSMNMSTSVRKANSKFFAYTGIAALTKGLRIGAMGVGMDFIIESVGDKAKMEELGLNDSDVHTYTAEDGEVELAVTKEQIVQALVAKSTGNVDPASFDAIAEAAELKISKALYNFVDSSIVRPNAAHRPAWASDPRFQIFAYLKQYTWSFREVIVQQAKVRSERDGSAVPIFALMSFVPLMLISDVLRGEIFGTNKGTADIGGMMLGSLARSGVMGVGTFGLDAIEDYNRGGVMNAAAGALGPVADHAGDALGNFGGKISDERLAARTLPLGSMVRGLKRKYFPAGE